MNRTNSICLTLVLSLSLLCLSNGFTFFEENPMARIAEMKAGTHNPFRDFNQWINALFYDNTGLGWLQGYLDEKLGREGGYYAASYGRDLVLGSFVYWGTAAVWHVVIYKILGRILFTNKGRSFPTTETFVDQMSLAQASLFVYAALPILSEFLIESKITRTYYYIDQVGGWGPYAAYLVLYIILVEIGVYWMHRTLHENKLMYKYLHALHHKYNKDTTMTPWCSLAFNPLDGICQASPYVICLFLVPVHYYTHMFLLFFSGIWATNIHDSVPQDTEPIMGAKYHTVHHTHYHYNYGQFFVFCDYFWGTLRLPKEKEEPPVVPK